MLLSLPSYSTWLTALYIKFCLPRELVCRLQTHIGAEPDPVFCVHSGMEVLSCLSMGNAPIIVALGNSTVPTVLTRLKGGTLALTSGLLPTAGKTIPSPQAQHFSSVPWILLLKGALWGQVTSLVSGFQ